MRRNWGLTVLRLFPPMAILLAIFRDGVEAITTSDWWEMFDICPAISGVLRDALEYLGYTPTFDFIPIYLTWLLVVGIGSLLMEVLAFLPDLCRSVFERKAK